MDEEETAADIFFSKVQDAFGFFLDVVAYIYALYCSSLFAAVLLMFMFDIIFTVTVAISTGLIAFQVFAFLGVLILGPLISMLEEPLLNVFRVATTAGNRHLALCAMIDEDRDANGKHYMFGTNNDDVEEAAEFRQSCQRPVSTVIVVFDLVFVLLFVFTRNELIVTVHSVFTLALAGLCALFRTVRVIYRNWLQTTGEKNTENMWFVECTAIAATAALGINFFWQGLLRDNYNLFWFGIATAGGLLIYSLIAFVLKLNWGPLYHSLHFFLFAGFVTAIVLRAINIDEIDETSVDNDQRWTALGVWFVIALLLAICTMLSEPDKSRGGRNARTIVVIIGCVVFICIGLFSSINVLPSIPNEEREIDLTRNSSSDFPYTVCKSHWYRFNITDAVLMAQATYYPPDNISTAFKNWFSWNYTQVTTTSNNIKMRAFHFDFHKVLDASNNTIEDDVQVIAIRGSFTGSDWLQNGFIWGDSVFFSTFHFFTPFFLPTDVISALVAAANWLRYGVFGDCSYFSHLRRLSENVIEYSKQNGRSGNVLVIGHSLGGGLAQLAGSKLNIPAVAVSGVGVGYQADTVGFDISRARRFLTNIVPHADAVPRIDEQIGDVQNIDCPAGSPLDCHGVANTFEELARSCGDIRVIRSHPQEGKTPMMTEIVLKIISGVIFVLISLGVYHQHRRAAPNRAVAYASRDTVEAQYPALMIQQPRDYKEENDSDDDRSLPAIRMATVQDYEPPLTSGPNAL